MREDEASETDSTASAHSAHSKHSRASKGSGITDLSSDEEVVEFDSDASSSSFPGVEPATLPVQDTSSQEDFTGSTETDSGTDETFHGTNDKIQPRHTHTAWSTEVFTLTDNRNYKDLRVQIKPNYQWPNMLGNRETQKSLSCSKYGDARENPTVTKMLLEAWSLWRLTWGDGRFLKEHPDIAKQRETDVEKLKEKYEVITR